MDPNDLHYIHPAHPPYASQENINSEHQHTLSPGIYQPSFPNSFQHCHSFQSTSESAEREILSMTYSPQVTAPASSSQTIPIFPTSSLTQAASGSSLPFTQSLAEHTRYRDQENRKNIDSPEVHGSQPHTILWNTQTPSDGGAYQGLDKMPAVTCRQPVVDLAGPPDISFAATLGRGDDPRAFQRLSGYHEVRNDQQRFECFQDCRWRRLGVKGFSRRANLLVHLRNCHGQQIPKHDRRGRGRGKK
ncbi:hypothetical protein DFP73DRAFT_592090 [Morchella snyderi]|nr:hypothetical protein DFP73DRAFT_592090 [Morchella snyderi]